MSVILFFMVLFSGCERSYDEPLKIAYIKFSTIGNIFIIDKDGSNEKQLTTHNLAQYPCFSADGEKIAYILNGTPDKMEIIDLQGRLLKSFSLPGNNFVNTAWSPDGDLIATYDSNIIYIYSTNGGLINSRQDGILYQGGVNFLSDSEVIIGVNGSYCDIWNFKTGAVNTLAVTFSGSNTYSSLSTDRNQYLWFMSGPGILYHTTINTATTVSLGNNRPYPSWLQDGKDYIFTNGADANKLYIHNMAGNTDTLLTNYPAYCSTVQGFPK
jgi:Tol biopolymer transport system component